jgi:hypothetical protein
VFTPEAFRTTFTEHVNSVINAEYPDVVITPHLTQKEFAELFPTERERRMLKQRQAQAERKIAAHVERLLESNAGNRREKLVIIQEALSENWDTDFVTRIIEELR